MQAQQSKAASAKDWQATAVWNIGSHQYKNLKAFEIIKRPQDAQTCVLLDLTAFILSWKRWIALQMLPWMIVGGKTAAEDCWAL